MRGFVRCAFVRSAVLAAGVGLVSCASTGAVPVETSHAIPAASARVSVARDGPNTRVALRVEHLAPPARVVPGASTWVVWARQLGDADQPPQNLGVLPLDKNLRGKLQTLTAFREFELFVTPEPSGLVSRPTGPELISARVVPR